MRWQCSRCGRFVAESAVHSEDRIDPGAYYGVTSRTWADCSLCGEVDEPRLVILAAMAADHLGQPMADMPAANRKALDAVQWPDVARPVVAPDRPTGALPANDVHLPELETTR